MLQQNLILFSGERPYMCTFCDQSFTQKHLLTSHLRRHEEAILQEKIESLQTSQTTA